MDAVTSRYCTRLVSERVMHFFAPISWKANRFGSR